MKIQFRCWDGEAMRVPDYVDNLGMAYWKEGGFVEYSTLDVMMFTGLKDAKGVDIYQGDIIRSIGSNGSLVLHEILYDKNTASFVAKYHDTPFVGHSSISQKWICEFEKEVIGNIYQELTKNGLLDGK